ncbi:MAG TPA: N-formylglutamate amidohydrolase [Fibrobacteraceae bacterium]|nr:N-formylglutamate amidohydrolase [Fibrobacteraceae bacterium]
MGWTILLTCEHASNRIPPQFRSLFQHDKPILESHRGWDPGAYKVCTEMARRLGLQASCGEWSRLVIDLNRSESNPHLFSRWSNTLSPEEKEGLIRFVHRPFRQQVANQVQQHLAAGKTVLHLSIHSFTPVLDGDVRNNDVGLLYDPHRVAERQLAVQWERNLKETPIRVRRNYPYRGISDGHVTELRRKYQQRYLGFEIEMNQAYLEKHPARSIVNLLLDTLPPPTLRVP